MVDAKYVVARKEARELANSLADMICEESGRLVAKHGQHGQVAAEVFLEQLRDYLVAIRPFPVVEPAKVAQSPVVSESSDGAESDWTGEVPSRYVLVQFDGAVEAVTDKAVRIGDQWVPRSQLWEIPAMGSEVVRWPVSRWFAEKEGLEVLE